MQRYFSLQFYVRVYHCREVKAGASNCCSHGIHSHEQRKSGVHILIGQFVLCYTLKQFRNPYLGNSAAHGGLGHPTRISNLGNAHKHAHGSIWWWQSLTELSSSHVCQVDNQPKLAMMTCNNSVWITIETEERKKERQGKERIKKV